MDAVVTAAVVTTVTWFSAIGCGLMAGVYFTFSIFVIRALQAIDPAAGIAAMQSVNRVILRSAFMPLFFGTTVAALFLTGWGLWDEGGPVRALLVGGGVIYLLGMFACTVFRNVPMNAVLDRLDPMNPASHASWSDYVRNWTRWNHLRTVASTLASLLFMAAVTS